MIVSACRAPGPALTARVAALAASHDDVIVAVDDHEIATAVVGVGSSVVPPSLVARWAAARGCVAGIENAWATPLVASPGLITAADRFAALRARVGAFETLIVESAALAAAAKQAGVVVDTVPRVADNGAVAAAVPAARRALVVVRAQPFHRGHLALIVHAAAIADEVVVVVAAADKSHAPHDPFTAGERLAMVRAAIKGVVQKPVWLLALPSPSWSAMALPQLAFCAPAVDVVVAHNPILRAMAIEHGFSVVGLNDAVRVDGDIVSGTAIRARLMRDGGGPWLEAVVPAGVQRLLLTSSLLARCAALSATEHR